MARSLPSPSSWVRQGTRCADCQQTFTLFTKKDNCCCCGGLFCSKCLTAYSGDTTRSSSGLDGAAYVCKSCLSAEEEQWRDGPPHEATTSAQVHDYEYPSAELPISPPHQSHAECDTMTGVTDGDIPASSSSVESAREANTVVTTSSWQHLQSLSSDLLNKALALRDENDRLLEQLSAKTILLELTQRELQSADVRRAAAESRAAEQEMREHALRAELASAAKLVEATEEGVRLRYKEQLSAVEATCKERTEELDAQIVAYKQRLAERQAELDQLQKRYNEQEHWISELQRETTRLRDELSGRHETIVEEDKAVQKELQDTRIALSEAERRSTELQSNLETARSELHALRAQLTVLQESVAQADAKTELEVKRACRRLDETYEQQTRTMAHREVAQMDLIRSLQCALDASTKRCQQAEEALARGRAGVATYTATPQTRNTTGTGNQAGADAADAVERRREELSGQQQRVLGSMLEKIQLAAGALTRRHTILLAKEAKLRRREAAAEAREAALMGRDPRPALATRVARSALSRTMCVDHESDTSPVSCSSKDAALQVMSAEPQHRAARLAGREHNVADHAKRLRREKHALVQHEYERNTRLAQLSQGLSAKARRSAAALPSITALAPRSTGGRATLVAECRARQLSSNRSVRAAPAANTKGETPKHHPCNAGQRTWPILSSSAAAAVGTKTLLSETASQLLSSLESISEHLLAAIQRA